MRYSRRDVLCRFGAAAGAAAFSSRVLHGQTQTPSAPTARSSPPSVVSNPPRDFSPGAPPVTYPDPDIITIDPSFGALRLGNTAIQRLWTGAYWSEGPAWSSQGRYLVWSDIPNNRQLRYVEDDGRVTVFRSPSNNSNGNAFDFEGRQLSCEHGARRVVRYEHDGSIAIIADKLRRQATQLAERCRGPSGRKYLVHRPAVWRFALRGAGRRSRRTEQPARSVECEGRTAGRFRADEA